MLILVREIHAGHKTVHFDALLQFGGVNLHAEQIGRTGCLLFRLVLIRLLLNQQ